VSNKVKQAKDLLSAVSTMIESAIRNLQFNKKKKAVIISLNGDGTANIKINDENFENIKIKTGLSPIVGEVVWVEIPNNNMSEMYIDTAQNVTAIEGETAHVHSNLTLLESISSTLLSNWNSAYTHITDIIKHITSNERNLWNTVTNKVDIVVGKQLSTEDFTTIEKTKLAGIASGAEVNVNADWNAVSGDAQILNKPTIPTQTNQLTNNSNFVVDASYVHTDNNYTTIEKNKLSGIEASANNYIHPSTHNADMIIDGTTNKAFTATEKTKLSGIATGANNYILPVASATIGGVKSGTDITVDASGNVSINDDSHNHIISNIDGLQTALDGKVDDSQVLTNVPVGALFTDTIYTHPINHPPSIITQDINNRFVTDAEKSTWNGKQDLLGFTPVNTTDSRLSDARAPLAHTHIVANITDFPTIPTDTNQLAKTDVYTKTEVNNLISSSGGGDMLTSQYDTNADGKVNSADAADRLVTPRTINGVSFDGSANIAIEDSTKVNKNGDTMSGKLILPASTTSDASINIPHGIAPTSPTNGDIWTTTSAPMVKLNGTTRTIYHSGNATTAALSTVSQAFAEAGSSITVYGWTPQRVRQAIEAVSPYYAGTTPPSNTMKIWIDTN
jgi:hypothetical protein